jgi:hypothetical protein
MLVSLYFQNKHRVTALPYSEIYVEGDCPANECVWIVPNTDNMSVDQCIICSRAFAGNRADKRFCSNACKQKHYRLRR